jgi:AraC-like DNA-binding protein
VGAVEGHLGVRVTKGADYAISFTSADAHRPFLTENDQMWRVLAPDLRRRLHDLQSAASAADRVRAALLEALPAGDPSIHGVTNRLATSSRTLQRQLSAEGTTFQAILAGTREDLARHYLTNQDLRSADIAYLLGYDDTNSFYRAFKTWTGTTPDSFRSAAAAVRVN